MGFWVCLPHDEFLYLGGNEQGTHKYVSELLGKQTIDTNTYGKSSGKNGNYSTNYQISGRELLTPDEVRMLDNRYALLFIRGELAVMDEKIDIMKHPNVAYTSDGNSENYRHGDVVTATAAITILRDIPEDAIDLGDIEELDIDVFSSQEIEELLEFEYMEE